MSGSESSSPAAVPGLPPQPLDAPRHDEPLSFTVHALPEPALEQRRRTASGRLQMLLVLLVCAAPVLASYTMYYVARPATRTAQGHLVEPPREMPGAEALPLRDAAGTAVDPLTLRGQWLLVVAADGSCDAGCEKRLFLQRQLREMLGREKDRLDRVWFLTGPTPMREALAPAMHQATVLSADRTALAAWLESTSAGEPTAGLDGAMYLVDPLGRLMMRFPADGDPVGIKRDIDRVLRASASWDRPGRDGL
jgi:hypothetical protein